MERQGNHVDLHELCERVERLEAAIRTAFSAIVRPPSHGDETQAAIRALLRQKGRAARAVEIVRWLSDERGFNVSITDVRRSLEHDQLVEKATGESGTSRGWWRLAEPPPDQVTKTYATT